MKKFTRYIWVVVLLSIPITARSQATLRRNYFTTNTAPTNYPGNLGATNNLFGNGIVATNSFRLISGGGSGLVLTSDANGNGTWSAASGGSTPSNFPSVTVTNFIRGPRVMLGLSGTNVTGLDLNLGTEFILMLTTNAFVGTPSNLQNTNVWQTIAIHVINDTTGGYTLTWTNGTFGWQGGAAPVQTTNASAYDIYTFTVSALTNSTLVGVQTFNLKR